MPLIFVAGHYGFSNTGDEAILGSLIAHLRELRPETRFIVASGTPEKTACEYAVESVMWSDVRALHRAISESDMVIVGGGGIFHDYAGVETETVLTDNHRGISYFSGMAVMASLYRKPVMLYAVGVGPLFSERARALTRCACDAAAAITVRDGESKEILESIGVAPAGVTVTADPAFAMPMEPQPFAPIQELKARGPVIAVAPRHWNFAIDEPFWQKELAGGLDLFLGENEGTALFVTFQRSPHLGQDDRNAAERIRSMMRLQDRAVVLDCHLPPQQIRGTLADCSLIVGMRLHSAILGMLGQTPLVGISYDPKVRHIMKSAGLQDFTIEIACLRARVLAETMTRALAQKRQVDVPLLAAQARENARIAIDILDSAAQGNIVRDQLPGGLDARELLAKFEQYRSRDAVQTAQLLQAQRDLEELREVFEQLRRAQQQNEATIASLRRESAERQLQLEATVTSLQAETAELQDRIASLKAALHQERAQLAKAEGVRSRTVISIDRFHHRLSSALATYRSQRAWTVMIALRKGFTLLTRGEALRFAAWALRLPVKGPGDLHEFELDFPNIWKFLPEGLQTRLDVRQKIATDALPRRKYDIIVFPIFDFEFRFQRPQQITAQFARQGHRVFWISPSRLLPESGDALYEAVLLRENLWEVRVRGPRPDLYEGSMTSAAAAGYAASLAGLYRDFHISESTSLLQFPYWRQAGLALARQFGTKLVYDCMDDWQSWTAEPRISEANLEDEVQLAKDCDVLLTSSDALCERHQASGLKPLLIRNGADFSFFSAAPGNGHAPGVQDVPRPVVGYYGAIANWFDLDLITQVAQSRPQYSFLLIGHVHDLDISRLQALPNVFLPGEKDYREIPRFLSNFDVSLIPFKINTLTSAVDPVKLYEYFSQGKPVVATDLPELQRVSALIYTASDAEGFARQIDRALAETDPQLRTQRIHFSRANTWAARVEEIDRAITARFPLVSILIVTYNCHEFIGPCLDSVARNTSWPNYEVIVVDNNSNDRSGEIAGQHAAADPRVRVIHNPENAGFAGANNIAAQYATGDYLLFLNPDTIVTPGWIGRLVRHFEASSPVGAVAAVTNFSGNETKINFDYSDVLEMERFAMKLAVDHPGESREIAVAPLYCVLVSKTVWTLVGELDDGFEVGTFEDDDFSRRIQEAGYRVIAAEDCFIHHFGNGSFSKLPSEESLRIFEQNKQRFERKWNTAWQPHRLRPGADSPYGEIRFTPEEFLVIDSESLPRDPEPMVLRRLHPEGTRVGETFNCQPDGNAAIVVECANATPTTVIVMGSTTLATSYGSPNALSALVPAALYAKPGTLAVSLLNDLGESNRLDFEVRGS